MICGAEENKDFTKILIFDKDYLYVSIENFENEFVSKIKFS